MSAGYDAPEQVPTRKMIEHPNRPGIYFPVHTHPIRRSDVDYASKDVIVFATYRLTDCGVRMEGKIGCAAWDGLMNCHRFIGYRLHAACQMPDHVHLVLSPSGNGENCSAIVGRTKLAQSFNTRNVTGAWLRWQRSYYDYVLHNNASDANEYAAVCAYVLANPVRGGLVNDPEEYPFIYIGYTR